MSAKNRVSAAGAAAGRSHDSTQQLQHVPQISFYLGSCWKALPSLAGGSFPSGKPSWEKSEVCPEVCLLLDLDPMKLPSKADQRGETAGESSNRGG